MSFIADQISRLMFNPANSCPPRSPTQTRAQRQQQLQYPASTTICSIQLHDNDRIRLINAPPSLIPLLRHTIASTWNQPILQEISKVYCGTYEFWVGGKPWAPSLKTGPSLTSMNLVLAMRRAMEEVGWSLILASNMSRVREENDSLFFEWTGGFPARPWLSFHHQQQLPVQVQEKDTNRGPWLSTQQQQQQVPLQEKDADQMTLVSDVSGHKNAEHLTLHEAVAAATPAGVESFTVEFFGYDTIRVPTDVPIAILTALRLAILRHWTQGIEREGDKKGVHEFTFTGFPFQTWGIETTIEVSMMIIQALENMRLHGYRLCKVAMDRDVVGGKTKTQDNKDKKEKKEKVIVDSWVLRRIQ